MAAPSHPLKSTFDDRVKGGEDAKLVGAELGIKEPTWRRWVSLGKKADAGVDAPTDIEVDAPPPRVTSAPLEKNGKKQGRKRAPITEETAGKLLEGCFFLGAMINHEPLWMLDKDERDSLASPFAESLTMIPAPISNAVNTYAAPGVFLTSLVAVMAAKQRKIGEKKRAQRLPVARMPVNAAGVTPTPHAPQAPPKPSGLPINDIAAAVAASRPTLTEVDEQDENERNFLG